VISEPIELSQRFKPVLLRGWVTLFVFKRVDQTGSHVKLRYIHPEGEKRTVIVPLHDELDTGTLKSIAEQAGSNEFQAFLDELEKMV